mmetsp:Transcript_19558/g.67100  ORF Transcript_19558/g.67100 Transcript_19558/m.67100 type:complete len:332 (+) Transcript_19558:2-997(+)
MSLQGACLASTLSVSKGVFRGAAGAGAGTASRAPHHLFARLRVDACEGPPRAGFWGRLGASVRRYGMVVVGHPRRSFFLSSRSLTIALMQSSLCLSMSLPRRWTSSSEAPSAAFLSVLCAVWRTLRARTLDFSAAAAAALATAARASADGRGKGIEISPPLTWGLIDMPSSLFRASTTLGAISASKHTMSTMVGDRTEMCATAERGCMLPYASTWAASKSSGVGVEPRSEPSFDLRESSVLANFFFSSFSNSSLRGSTVDSVESPASSSSSPPAPWPFAALRISFSVTDSSTVKRSVAGTSNFNVPRPPLAITSGVPLENASYSAACSASA